MKKSVANVGIAVLVALLVSTACLLSACSSMGKKAGGTSTATCPLCGEATAETAIKDMKYTKCACPDCKTVSTIDPFAPASMADYVGPGATTVHVCDNCDCMVAVCPDCR